ncbi:hypothetical protein GMD78_18605 [Ornithinibacillus sp. L9]|uniref:Permease n=1 Tax=Ornithinibacillus caprae TaxID=2678566 RepID=A0A6N8FLZ5_9BACI|nr:hypothetical protein [Ornithinibacillus caprae]MUK90373.1 hypothetical protein [Ornithinibacillus caprae]
MRGCSKLRDPGFFLTVVLLIYAGFVFIWWPADVYVAGISLVGWLMFVGLFFWFLLAIVYCLWIENLEKKEE